jgi:hypothetical protein
MSGENLYTRIPPSSTGDRIHLRQSVILPYSNKGGTDFILQDFYTLDTSGIRIQVHVVYPTNSISGFLWVHFSPTDLFNGLDPTTGENILDLDGNIIAEVAAGYYPINTNANTTVGYNNPQQGQFVDQFGSAYIRTEEGNIGLDAFGKLRTSGATLLGEYVFGNNTLPSLFSNTISGSGAVSWDNDRRTAVISVGQDINDQITHTSNTYHHYLPGSSHQFIGTFALGDTGKSGLVRNWGLFDSDNGFMFSERNGEFGVVVRSSASGTKVDTFISQSDFNGDVLDGTGLSQMSFDRTYDNIYWIDVQWLGGGRVRFGTYNNGERIVMHEYYGGNVSIYPLSQTASLPVCMSMKNISGTASTSEMRSWCQAVYTETTFDIEELGQPKVASLGATISGSQPTGSYNYIGTLTPAEFIQNQPTQYNRAIYFPTAIDIEAWDSVTGDPVLLEFEVYFNPVLSGVSFEPTEYITTVERDLSATYIDGVYNSLKKYFRGSTTIDLTDTYTNITYGAFKNNSERGGIIRPLFTNITNEATASAVFDISQEGQLNHREDQFYTISGVGGMTEINGLTVYPKNTSISSSLLFLDENLTQAVDTTTSGSYTSGGRMEGLKGSQIYFTLVAQKQIPNSNDIEIRCVVNWREIDQ